MPTASRRSAVAKQASNGRNEEGRPKKQKRTMGSRFSPNKTKCGSVAGMLALAESECRTQRAPKYYRGRLTSRSRHHNIAALPRGQLAKDARENYTVEREREREIGKQQHDGRICTHACACTSRRERANFCAQRRPGPAEGAHGPPEEWGGGGGGGNWQSPVRPSRRVVRRVVWCLPFRFAVSASHSKSILGL